MRSMAQQRVPPTPNNFHLWFKYSLGAPADLKRAIDILIGNKRKFDATTNRDLFATYVGSHSTDDRGCEQRFATASFGHGFREAVSDRRDRG